MKLLIVVSLLTIFAENTSEIRTSFNDVKTIPVSYETNITTTFEEFEDSATTYAAPSPDIDIDPGDPSGGYSNISFSKAFTIEEGTESTYIANAAPRYYKYVAPSKLSYMSIYSCGDLNTKVTIYDSTYTEIDYRFCPFVDSVPPAITTGYVATTEHKYADHARDFTSGENFFVNFYCEPYETYYFKIEIEDQTDSGNTNLTFMKDNWAYKSNNLSYYAIGDDFVENGYVYYKNSSKYTNEISAAIEEWEKLGEIQFIESTTNYSFEIVDEQANNSSGMGETFIEEQKMVFYENNMDTVPYISRLKVAIHEFGHALGMNDEFTGWENESNMMVQGQRFFAMLGPADIAVYEYLWG